MFINKEDITIRFTTKEPYCYEYSNISSNYKTSPSIKEIPFVDFYLYEGETLMYTSTLTFKEDTLLYGYKLIGLTELSTQFKKDIYTNIFD